MDAKMLFRLVSEKMRTDFQAASQFVHKGTRGTARENTLREFLAKGRLPAKYGLGSGATIATGILRRGRRGPHPQATTSPGK
jgi:hypothetical protein